MKIVYGDAKLVSVIMTAYNAEKTIEQSVKSVINQTYANWELIVVDDGSKDETVRIIEKMQENDARIMIYKNIKNQGVAKSRNKGISEAQGNLIAFLDSDDMWVHSKLEIQINNMKKLNSDFSFTGASFINEENKLLEGNFRVPMKVDYNKLKKHNVISCSSVIINKKFFKKNKMERDDIHEDFVLWLKILRQGNIAHGINEPLLTYRVSTSSKSGNKVKSILMTYKVYRFLKINPISSSYYTLRHLIGAFCKYRRIKNNNEDVS